MRSDIRAEMELKIENVTRKAETNIKKCSDTRNAEIEKIKVDAMKKAQSIEAKEVGENTMIVFKSYTDAGFSQEQAWELLKIVVAGSVTK